MTCPTVPPLQCSPADIAMISSRAPKPVALQTGSADTVWFQAPILKTNLGVQHSLGCSMSSRWISLHGRRNMLPVGSQTPTRRPSGTSTTHRKIPGILVSTCNAYDTTASMNLIVMAMIARYTLIIIPPCHGVHVCQSSAQVSNVSTK